MVSEYGQLLRNSPYYFPECLHHPYLGDEEVEMDCFLVKELKAF